MSCMRISTVRHASRSAVLDAVMITLGLVGPSTLLIDKPASANFRFRPSQPTGDRKFGIKLPRGDTRIFKNIIADPKIKATEVIIKHRYQSSLDKQ